MARLQLMLQTAVQMLLLMDISAEGKLFVTGGHTLL
jgi:hypothetical protein